MNRVHWCLLIAAVPIVLTAQFVLHYKEAQTRAYVDRADGSGAALLRVTSGWNHSEGTEVIAWDAGVTNRRTLLRQSQVATDYQASLSTDAQGRFVVLSRMSGVVCLDNKSGEERWFSGQAPALRHATRVDFVNQDQHLLVTRRSDGDKGSSVAVLSVESGECLRDIVVDDFARCLTKGNRLAIQYSVASERFGQWDLFEVDGDNARFVETTDFAPREMLPVEKNVDLDVSMTTTYPWENYYSWGSQESTTLMRSYLKHAATVEIDPATAFSPEKLCSTQPSNKNTIRVSLLGFGESLALLMVAALAVAIWTMVFAFDGAQSVWRFRLIVDTVAITILLVFVCVPLSRLWGQEQTAAPMFLRTSVTTLFLGCVPALLSALLLSVSFAGLLTERRAFYLWGSFILACALPVLLPSIAVIVFLLFRGYRFVKTTHSKPVDVFEDLLGTETETEQASAEKSKLRFGIGEVMLITTGVALFIAIGQLSFFLFFWGFLLAGLFAVSVLLAGESIQATTLFLASFLVVILGAGHRFWDLSGTGVFVFALPMFFALAAVHHFRVAKPIATIEA